jgi:hypothetical protein
LLRDLYRHLGTPDRLVDLAETMLWSTRSSAAQKQLRLDLARALLESPAKVDLAVATLKGILEDEPNHAEARDALADVLEREGRHEELVGVLSAGLGLLNPAGRRVASMRLGRAEEVRTAEAASVYVRLAEDGDASVEELSSSRLVSTYSTAPSFSEQLVRREKVRAHPLSHRLVELRVAKHDRPGIVRALSLGFALHPRTLGFATPARDLRGRRSPGRALEVSVERSSEIRRTRTCCRRGWL